MWKGQEMMSRLPEDPGYWGRLTDRLVANATSQLRTYRVAPSGRWQALARLSMPLAIGAAAAVIIALLRLPDSARGAVENTTSAAIYDFLPTDPLVSLLVTSASAPTIATLLSTLIPERIQ